MWNQILIHQKANREQVSHKDETIRVKMVLKRTVDNIHRQTSNIFRLTPDHTFFFLSSVGRRAETSPTKKVNTRIWTLSPFVEATFIQRQTDVAQ